VGRRTSKPVHPKSFTQSRERPSSRVSLEVDGDLEKGRLLSHLFGEVSGEGGKNVGSHDAPTTWLQGEAPPYSVKTAAGNMIGDPVTQEGGIPKHSSSKKKSREAGQRRPEQ